MSGRGGEFENAERFVNSDYVRRPGSDRRWGMIQKDHGQVTGDHPPMVNVLKIVLCLGPPPLRLPTWSFTRPRVLQLGAPPDFPDSPDPLRRVGHLSGAAALSVLAQPHPGEPLPHGLDPRLGNVVE